MRWMINGTHRLAGRTLARAAIDAGDEVVAVAPKGTSLVFEGALRTALCDRDDEKALREACEGCDVAAQMDLHSPFDGTRSEHEAQNLVATEVLLDAARSAGVKRFVLQSSEIVTAGDVDRNSIDEDFAHSDQFLSPFAETMSVTEGVSMAQSGRGGMFVTALRTGWVWGAGDESFLPHFLRRSEQGALSFPAGGARQTITTHADNLALAALSAAKTAAAEGAIYYVTDDELVSVRSFFTKLFVAAGARAPRSSMMPYYGAYARAYVGEKLGLSGLTVHEVVALGRRVNVNIKKAREELGYAPKTTIFEGMKSLATWASALGGAKKIAALKS